MYASLGCGALSAKCTAGANILGKARLALETNDGTPCFAAVVLNKKPLKCSQDPL